MERPLLPLLSLVLVFVHGARAWDAAKYCEDKSLDCPQYQRIESSPLHFEIRKYDSTTWITTEFHGAFGVMAANSRLWSYYDKLGDAADHQMNRPAMITITGENDAKMSWFVPPGVEKPTSTPDQSVIVEERGEDIVYVWYFTGPPNLGLGKENAEKLWKAMGKSCDLPIHSGVTYNWMTDFEHNNEIWIRAVDIKC